MFLSKLKKKEWFNLFITMLNLGEGDKKTLQNNDLVYDQKCDNYGL